ncbi:MAG: SRPBCC family protein [Sciscionella sp.]
MDRGSYLEHEGRPAVRFERIYPHPITRVWDAVARPDGLARWFPSTVDLEGRVGGTISFFDDPNTAPSTGTVLVFDPPEHLAFTWADNELHVDLEAIDDDHTRLILTDVLAARDEAARNAAGWTVCLGELDKQLAGQRSEGPHSATAAAWQPIYDDYVAAGMPSGADIPTGTT